MRLLVTGGGTGGHIYPALAIAQGYQKRHPELEVLYVGTAKGLEASIVPKAGIKFTTITVEGLQRKLSWRTLGFGVKLIRGLGQARAVVKEFKPDLVVGTGGYVCGPVVYQAAKQGIPCLIHEQNAYPGITNKLLSRYVEQVAVTFADSLPYFTKAAQVTHTGLPIREEILSTRRQQGLSSLQLDPNKLLVLVTGGSRGARSINQAMVAVHQEMARRNDVQVIHLTGQLDYDETIKRLAQVGIDVASCPNLTVLPYLYNMADAMAAADLIVCRAGATTLAEVTAKGIPAILIPYPYAAENHQEHNANSLVRAEAAQMILDKDLTGEKLTSAVGNLIADKTTLSRMQQRSLQLGRPNALRDILDILDQMLKLH